MKYLLLGITMLFLLITTTTKLLAQDQYRGKRQMFKQASDRIPAAIAELEKAFGAKSGDAIRFSFQHLEMEGVVVNSVKRYDNLYSAIIKIPADGTLLSVSKRIGDDKSVTYTGRILNNGSSDGYELIKNADGSYVFHKIRTEDLIQDY